MSTVAATLDHGQNGCGPGVASTEATDRNQSGGMAGWDIGNGQLLYFTEPPAGQGGALPMPITQPKRRGIAARCALLAVARECERRRAPLPSYDTLAGLIGISHGQISRHMAMILDEGTFTTRRNGRRVFIERAGA